MPFTGFAKDAPRFFHELAIEMNRDWWNEHKPEYQTLWVEPMTALLDEVRTKLAPAYQGIALQAPKLFRIHRDVRFAKDKTPYKTFCAGVIKLGDGETVMETGTALYLQLGLEEFSGSGYYSFADDHLPRWRKAVSADKTGKQIESLLAKAASAGFGLDAHQVLARAPRGTDPDHPRAALLRHKGCTLSFPAIPRGLIHKPAFVTWLVAQATAAAPVVRWLHANVDR